jgi:predicted nucleotidyltransferase
MLKNTLINRLATKKIALALDNLNEKVVYVGGAVVSLYIDDTAANDVRPTMDIDIVIEISTIKELEDIRQELTEKGFIQSSEDDIVCRFRYEDIIVDVMATKPIDWAPANPWFASGYKNLITYNIDNIKINCLSLPYFLATKFSAFYSRGSTDPRTSHDFEDIVYLLNYISNLKMQLLEADIEVKNYLIECFNDILNDPQKQEAIIGHLYNEEQDYRYKKILGQITTFINNS